MNKCVMCGSKNLVRSFHIEKDPKQLRFWNKTEEARIRVWECQECFERYYSLCNDPKDSTDLENLNKLELLKQRLRADSEFRQKLLHQAGITDSDGNLTKNYGGK